MACRGLSPAQFELPRKDSVVVHIEKEGFKPLEITLNPVISSEGGVGMAGNIFVGGLIGAAVDAKTGSMYDLTPNPLEVTLIPLDSHDEYVHEYASEGEYMDEIESVEGYEDFDPSGMTQSPYSPARGSLNEQNLPHVNEPMPAPVQQAAETPTIQPPILYPPPRLRLRWNGATQAPLVRILFQTTHVISGVSQDLGAGRIGAADQEVTTAT